MANMFFVSFRRRRRRRRRREENYLQKTLLQRGGQSQLGVDMATPSLSVLVMSSEILHALDGGRTVEGEGNRGGELRQEEDGGGQAGRQTTGWPAAECQKSECGT